MLKKEVRLFFVIICLLVGSIFLAGCPFEPDMSQYNLCDSNGDILLDDHALCLVDPGTTNDDLCCIKPDGEPCSDSDIEKLASNTADYWSEHIDAGEWSDEAHDDIYSQIINGFNSDQCFSSYSLVLATDSDEPVTLDRLIPMCSTSNSYSQHAIILKQGIGETEEEDPQENLFVCYQNRWYDYEDIRQDDEDTDNDGVGLFFDCDDEDPTVFSDMSMYVGWDSGDTPVEICGDQKDNLCLEPYDYISRVSSSHDISGHLDWEGDWDVIVNDSCDNNPYACENHCLFEGNSCDYLGYYEGMPEDIDLDPEDGYCCGDSLTDLGTPQDYEGTERICLNQEYVIPDFIESENCGDGWCWLNSQTNKFQIYTVKYFGNDTFDVFSNYDRWEVCSEENVGEVSARDEDPDRAGNRFYCYDEGDHYSFTECYDDEGAEGTIHNEGSIKHRTTGGSSFGLPLVESGDDNLYIVYLNDDLEGNSDYSDSYQSLYTIEGTLTQTIDFTGYDYLEVLFKFVGEKVYLPDTLNMTIKGLPQDINVEEGEDTIYFAQNILGYAVNDPLLEVDHNIHLRVPVADWPDIRAIILETDASSNKIEVLSMYLTKESDINSDTVPICSGKDDTSDSSWLYDLDDSFYDTYIDGSLICDFRYGPNAWLGDQFEEEVDEAKSQASCCGDDEGEFYAGKSSTENRYGCFNGVPIADEDTAMLVEFDVEYGTQEFEVSYPTVTGSAVINFPTEGIEFPDGYLPEEIPDISWGCEEVLGTDYYNYYCESTEMDCDCNLDSLCISDTNPLQTCTQVPSCTDLVDVVAPYGGSPIVCDVNPDYGVIYDGVVSEVGDVLPGAVAYVSSEEAYYLRSEIEEDIPISISYGDSPVKLDSLDIVVAGIPHGESATFTLTHNNPDLIDVYFFTPFNQEYHGDDININQEDFPTEFELWIVAETSIIEINSTEGQRDEQDLSYTCLNDECTYALPGSPPYEITNEHPELYDLYFVRQGDDGNPEEILITQTSQDFDELGVIKAKAISQQILYDFDYEEETGGFYGCNAAGYIVTELSNAGEPLDDNYNYCSIQGDYFCAHQDSNRLVNSWSQDSITQIAYEPVDEWDEDTELILSEVSYAATERNYSATVVPQRNFIPNADFEETEEEDADNLAYWTLLDNSDAIIENEINYRTDGVMTISSAYTFLSDNIAIQPYQTYSYADSSDCYTSITLINKDGTNQVVSVPESFESGEFTTLKIEVSGSCEYAEPMLQLTDELGAGAYEFNTEYPTRQGAACCPEGMCWNGYVCADNMAQYTYMTEEPQENSTYRCIDGVWSYLEPQWDWNGEEYGFCETEDQCFVTSSLSEGAEYGASLTDFYQGTYPLCINDGEYLLDHYCENGNWTSRTKFLATKLLEFAESDDFVLYCAPFRESLVDYATEGYNYENYLAGEVSATLETADTLAIEITGESEGGTTLEVCYDALENSETGRRLVDQKENTCINSVCVLQYKSSNTFEAAFATSLNNNITSQEDSFLIPLGVPQGELESYCSAAENTTDYIECDDALWYNSEINSVIYSKEGISFDPSLIDTIIDWFFGLFDGDVIEDSEDFISEAQNFNRIYLLSKEGFVVRAVEEINADQETLIAEYDNFDLPICDYINGVNEDYTMVEQWPAEPEMLVNCELTEEGVYRIMTATNTDYWWPQLTSKLRVSS